MATEFCLAQYSKKQSFCQELSDHWHLDINVEEKYRHLHLVVSDLPGIGFAITILTPSQACLL